MPPETSEAIDLTELAELLEDDDPEAAETPAPDGATSEEIAVA